MYMYNGEVLHVYTCIMIIIINKLSDFLRIHKLCVVIIN